MNEFGIRLRNMRLANNLSRSELCKMCGLNNPDIRIGSYETGKRSPNKVMIEKLAKALNVTERYLTYGIFDKETVVSLKDKGIFNTSYVFLEISACYCGLLIQGHIFKNDLEFARQLYDQLLNTEEIKHENNR